MSPSLWQVSGEKRPHTATWCYIRGNRAIGVGTDALVGARMSAFLRRIAWWEIFWSGFAVRCNGGAWSARRGLPDPQPSSELLRDVESYYTKSNKHDKTV